MVENKTTRPLSITFDFQFGEDVDKDVRAYLKDEVFPLAAAVLRQYLQVCLLRASALNGCYEIS